MNKLDDFFKDDRLEEILSLAKGKDDSIEKTLALLKAKFNFLKKQNIEGVLSREEYLQERNIIRLAVHELKSKILIETDAQRVDTSSKPIINQKHFGIGDNIIGNKIVKK